MHGHQCSWDKVVNKQIPFAWEADILTERENISKSEQITCQMLVCSLKNNKSQDKGTAWPQDGGGGEGIGF